MSIDPFEIRLEFMGLLERLNATQQALSKTTSFALMYMEHSEALYSCIMERMEKTSIFDRLNLFYLIDTLVNSTTNGEDYREFIKNDLKTILDLVVPLDGSLNVKHVTKILDGWIRKEIFENNLLNELKEYISNKTKSSHVPGTKGDIIRRIEEDRERHKKAKENVWMQNINASDYDECEFHALWDKTGALDDSDEKQILLEIGNWNKII